MSDNEGKNFSLLNLGSLTKPIDTATKGLIEGAGAFLSKICLPAAEEAGLLLRDRVSYWRALNLAKVLKKTEDKLKGEYKEISPKIILPLIENASLEEEAELQDIWTNLLASALDPNFNGKIRAAYIDIIRQLEVVDVHVLDAIYKDCIIRHDKQRQYFKEIGQHFSPNDYPVHEVVLMNAVGIDLGLYENSLDNLMRVRCVTSYIQEQRITINEHSYDPTHKTLTYDYGYKSVCITPLGVDFVEACIVPKSNSN